MLLIVSSCTKTLRQPGDLANKTHSFASPSHDGFAIVEVTRVSGSPDLQDLREKIVTCFVECRTVLRNPTIAQAIVKC